MICLERLPARPLDRISDAFDFQLGLQAQAFPVRAAGQREARLPNLAGERISRIEAAAGEHPARSVLHLDPQCTRDAGHAVVRETDDEAILAVVFVAPDERRAHAIADASCELIDRARISLVAEEHVGRSFGMPIPE